MEQETVTMQQMKDALAKETGSKFPLKITLNNGEVIVRYIRGFADQQTNILLISETSYSLGLKILEVKDIRTLEYAPEKTDGSWRILHANWWKKPSVLTTFLM
jgi:hypothetical protein